MQYRRPNHDLAVVLREQWEHTLRLTLCAILVVLYGAWLALTAPEPAGQDRQYVEADDLPF